MDLINQYKMLKQNNDKKLAMINRLHNSRTLNSMNDIDKVKIQEYLEDAIINARKCNKELNRIVSILQKSTEKSINIYDKINDDRVRRLSNPELWKKISVPSIQIHNESKNPDSNGDTDISDLSEIESIPKNRKRRGSLVNTQSTNDWSINDLKEQQQALSTEIRKLVKQYSS